MSLQSSGLKTETVPLSQIRRPIQPVLDHAKIEAMTSTLSGLPAESSTCKLEDITAGELPPIDVFLVQEQGKKYYFAFGGCHRFQAYERIAHSSDPLVKVKIFSATRKTLKVYLGSSVDKMFDDPA